MYQLIFPPRSTQNYALKENAIKNDVTALTLKLDPDALSNSGYQVIYSNATPSSLYDNGIFLALFVPAIQFNIEDNQTCIKWPPLVEWLVHLQGITVVNSSLSASEKTMVNFL